MLQGGKLFESVKRCRVVAAFWWLGQASFIVKLGKSVLLLDPFLKPMKERRVPPLFRAEDADGIVDLVLCTHDHLDHIDPVAVPELAKHTRAKFVAPRLHAERMRSLGVPNDRLLTLNDGESVTAAGVTVHAIKSSHELFHQTPDGLFPFLGYFIEGTGKTIYHSGDTVWWEGLQARLSRWKFDAMMLPINGRDAVRLKVNCIGNMVYQEAADLAGGLDVKLTVPMHYDMFAFNAENPQLFVDYVAVKYPGRRVWVGQPTEEVAF
jgi:L-ascorbate metabolism protein UlaG (beta-lactamase superfamily)